MKDRTKWVLAVAALALTVGAQATARAGNLSLPGCKYYSVLLHPGDRLTYSGSEEEYTMTVDDVTYSVQINPCFLYERCCFFSEDEITSCQFDSDRCEAPDDLGSGGGPGGGGGGVGMFGQSFEHSWGVKNYINQVISKGAFLRLELTEGPAGDIPPSAFAFDAISHSLYAEYIEKYKYERDRMFTEMFYPTWRQLIEPGMAAPGTANPSGWAVATDAKASSNAIGFSSWAVPTSESRHYQSPQIVQQGHAVTFLSMFGLTDHGRYEEAMAMVKGRVFVGAGGPVETGDFTISH